MSLNHLGNSTVDLVGKFVFPNTDRSVRKKDTRTFLVSLAVGMLFCFAFGYLLCVVNNHAGRL
jgi:hypothetical protein